VCRELSVRGRQLVSCIVLLAFVAADARAMPVISPGRRSPQVFVSGTALQSFFGLQGEHINVGTDQIGLERWPLQFFSVCVLQPNQTVTVQVELAGNSHHASYGVYSAASVTPAQAVIFPADATDGWFATVSFRSSPTRLIVNLFDNNVAFVGSTTYPGFDRSDVGFFVEGAGGTFFTQDARNPGSEPHALGFLGTGINSGSIWLAWEDQPAEQDFADAVMFFEAASECSTPVSETTWSRLKGLFR